MTTRTFSTYGELSSELAFDLIEQLRVVEGLHVEFGASNQSPSRYVNIEVLDEDGDIVGDGFKVRFSDHADRHGADITIRFDDVAEGIYDDCGEYIETIVADEAYQTLIARAVLAATAFANEAR